MSSLFMVWGMTFVVDVRGSQNPRGNMYWSHIGKPARLVRLGVGKIESGFA